MKIESDKIAGSFKLLLLWWICLGPLDATGQQEASAVDFRETVLIHHDKAVYLAGETFRFKVYCLEGPAEGKQRFSRLSTVAYVEIVDQEQNPVVQTIVSLVNGEGYGDFYVPLSINSGNYLLRSYTAWMRNFGPENFLQKEITILNPFMVLPAKLPEAERAAPGGDKKAVSKNQHAEIRYTIERDRYTSREEVNINLAVVKNDGEPSPARLSISVSKVPSFFGIESSGNSFSPKFPTSPPQEIQVLPEVKGRLLKAALNQPAGDGSEGRHLFLAIPGKNPSFFASVANEKGEAFFELDGVHGQREGFLVTQQDVSSEVEIKTGFHPSFAVFPFSHFDIGDQWRDFIQESSRAMQVENAYAGSRRQSQIKASADAVFFYGAPDETYLLDDYVRFPLIEEVLREYVYSVKVRKRRDQYEFRIVDMVNKGIFENPPLMLLDGLPFFDANRIIELDPLKVEKIEVVKRRYFLGRATFEGIVHFRTYNGDMGGVSAGSQYTGLQVQGPQPLKEYRFPSYPDEESRGSRFPDFRNTLYWDPMLPLDGNGEASVNFYTSDNKGKYLVRIAGIGANGSTCAKEFFIWVE